jgi:hypothetical protein
MAICLDRHDCSKIREPVFLRYGCDPLRDRSNIYLRIGHMTIHSVKNIRMSLQIMSLIMTERQLYI